MTLRSLVAMLVAAAMLFAPLATPAGGLAAAPVGQHAEMADPGHCGDQPGEREDGRSIADTCCVATCTVIAMAASALAEPPSFPSDPILASADMFRHGYLAKLATPPPRGA